MPLWQEQQLQSQWRQRCLHIDGNNAITMRVAMPAWQQATRATRLAQQRQRRLRINDGNEPIVTRATISIATVTKATVHWQQQYHHDEGINASSTTSNKGKNASSTMAETPAHQQRWQHYYEESGNCHCNNSKNACASTVSMPSRQGQQCQWRQGRLHIDDDNDVILRKG